MNIWWATIISAVAGTVGTGLGGLLSGFVSATDRTLGRLMSFSAGLMMGVVCFDLMPEALAMAGATGVFQGFFMGVAAVLLLERTIVRFSGSKNLATTALVIAAGIAAHNLPEGLAIGSGYAGAPALGASLCAVIALHDVPEGLAMGLPLRAAGRPGWRIAILAMITGLPTGLGGLLGYLTGGVSRYAVGLCLALAGGAMLTITCGTMIPESAALDRSPQSAIALAVGFALGLAVTVLFG